MSPMDWKSLLSMVLRRSQQPAVVLDQRGRIQLLNRAMERTLGHPEAEISGRSFARVFGAPGTRKLLAQKLGSVLRGAHESFEARLVSRDGRAFDASFTATLAGESGHTGVLLEGTLQPTAPEREVPPLPDVEVYEIDIHPGDFGHLRFHWPAAGSVPHAGAHCYQARYGAQTPCDDCPVRQMPPNGGAATTVVPGPDPEHYDIVTAEPVDPDHVRVRVCHVTDQTLSQLVQARVDRLAATSGLSERERDVLTYLLMGRTLQDIAKILGISRRTVKFHQGNVLSKVGADSRVDLMRFLL